MKSTQKPRVKPKRSQSEREKKKPADGSAAKKFEREGMGVAPKE